MSDVTIPPAARSTTRRAKDKVADVAQSAEGAAEDAESRLSATAAQLRARMESGAAAAREWAAHQPELIREQVTERPLIAVGVSAGTAFAAGLVLGVLLTSRR